MPDIKRVEHMVVWQEARQLNNIFATLVERTSFDGHEILRARLEETALDIFATIARAYVHRHEDGFADILAHALDLAHAAHTLLYAALDRRCIGQSEFEDVSDQIHKTATQLKDFVGFLRKVVCPEHLRGADPDDFFPKEIYNHLNESMEIQELIF